MKYFNLLLIPALFMGGCSKKHSEAGVGTLGLNPTNRTETLVGNVFSDNMVISDTRFKNASVIDVMLTLSGTATTLPHFFSGPNVTASYSVDNNASTVTIFNAQTAGQTGFIVAITFPN